MGETALRAIVVEPEILIALDVERVLTSVDGWNMDVAIHTRADLESLQPDCDLLVYSVELLCPASEGSMRAIADSGTAIVILTTSDELMSADLPWIRISKPFRNDELIDAVERALRLRRATLARGRS